MFGITIRPLGFLKTIKEYSNEIIIIMLNKPRSEFKEIV